MITHAPTTKALSKTFDATVSSLTTTFRRLPRRTRRARRLLSTLSRDALRAVKRHPGRALAAGLLLAGAAAATVARRA